MLARDRPCAPPWRDAFGRDKSFSGIVWLPAGSSGAVCADAPAAPNPNNPVKTAAIQLSSVISVANSQQINAQYLRFVS
jgi:hypothetical protein